LVECTCHFSGKHRWVVLGKTPLTKKAHKKSLTSIEQSLMAGSNCQAGQGKMAQQLS
jgi:hypothetical protein